MSNQKKDEAWLHKVHTIFLGIDKGRELPEELIFFHKTRSLILTRGASFSEIFVATKSEYLSECQRLDEEIILLKQALDRCRSKITEQKNSLHKLSQQHMMLVKKCNLWEQKSFQISCEYFNLIGQELPPLPEPREYKAPDTGEKKRKTTIPSLKKPKASLLLKEAQYLLKKLDSPTREGAERAYIELRSFLAKNKMMVSDVIIARPAGQKRFQYDIEEELFNRILEVTQLNAEIENSKEEYKDLKKKLNVVDAEVYNLEGIIKGAQGEIEIWTKKLQKQKAKHTPPKKSSAGPTVQQPSTGPHVSTQPHPPQNNQPTSHPTSSQAGPQAPSPHSQQPSPGTRIVTPPPTATPTSSSHTSPATQTTTATPSPTPTSSQAPLPKKKRIWTWPFRHPISTIAITTAVYFGGGYAVSSVGELFTGASYDVSKPATPAPLQTPSSTAQAPYQSLTQEQRGKGGYILQTQRTHYVPFYVAYEPISFWKKVANEVGSQRIDMLRFGDPVQVELPVGQIRIYNTDKWVHIKDTNNREGYVLGKQLSATVPVRAPMEPKSTESSIVSGAGKLNEETDQTINERIAPYEKIRITAYVCVGKELTTTINGSEIYMDSGVPIEACASIYLINEGEDAKIQLCSYKNHTKSPQARVFLSSDSRVAIYAPYEAISLMRSSCEQTVIISSNHLEPK